MSIRYLRIALILFIGLTLRAQVTEGLIAYYPLADNANDYSGNGYHGVLYGPAAGSGHNNDPSSAYYFNGESDYIKFPDFDPWTDFSVSGWFRVLNPAQEIMRIIEKDGGTGNDVFALNISDMGIVGAELRHQDETLRMINSNTALDDNDWHHFLVHRENDTFSLFIDNVFNSSAYIPSFTFDNSDSLTVGKWGFNESRFFEGAIDDIRIYNRALNNSEITELYHDGGWGPPVRWNVPSDFSSIQDAINASSNGDTVLAQPGIYNENINFNGKKIVVGSLFITTLDTSYIVQTIIDGSSMERVVTVNGSETNLSKLSGFTIQNGYSTSATAYPSGKGGGIFVGSNASPVLDNLIIQNSYAQYGGGGIYSDGSPLIINDKIRNNQTGTNGGGIYSANGTLNVDSTIITGNSGDRGGGIYSTSTVNINHTQINNNEATNEGGGLANIGTSTMSLSNCTIVANQAIANTGGGLFTEYSATTYIGNTILFFNTPEQVSQANNSIVSVEYSACENGQAGFASAGTNTLNWNGGIITDDPLFTDPVNNDFSLQQLSTCVDTGNPDLDDDGSSWESDIDDQDPDGTRMDIGAFYFHKEASTIMDIDGNIYETVNIGDQTWMAENLKVTHYRDGTAITNVTDAAAWGSLITEAYCIYNNNTSNEVDTYGALYNWYAITDAHNIAPEGWHIPTDAEWKELEMSIGMSQSDADAYGWRGTNEGSKLAGNADLWHSGALEDNSEFGSSGFTALPSGWRTYDNVIYQGIGTYADFWSATEGNNGDALVRDMDYTSLGVNRYYGYKRYGFAVRCIKNAISYVEIPQNLSATAGNFQVTLDWDDTGEADLAKYRIYRGLATAVYTLIDSVTSGNPITSVYTDNNVINGTTYYYAVKAVNGAGNVSDYSNEATVTLPILYSGPVWHISTTGSDQTGNGTYDLPFASIQNGIDASANGDTVLVRTGTFFENINFNGKSIVVGSMTLTTGDTSHISQTIIDGGQSGSVVSFAANEDTNTVLTGFTLTNGSGTEVFVLKGGGIYCRDSSPRLSHLIIRNNSALVGGGIYAHNSAVEFSNSIIRDNVAADEGGGLYAGDMEISITESIFDSNEAITTGGGLYFEGVSSGILEKVRITNNVSGIGGGLRLNGSSTDLQIIQCLIDSNNSAENGAGIYVSPGSLSFFNSTLVDNIITGGGSVGGIYHASGNLEVQNSILWGNDGESLAGTATIDLGYSCVEGGGAIPSEGIINSDPKFISGPDHGYLLSVSSPCKDAGNPDNDEDSDSWEIDPDDQDPDGTRMDMGAYYYHQTYFGPTWHISTNGSDENGEGSDANPLASIQAGINLSGQGDTILVRPGTYVENINFNGKNVVVSSLQLTTNDTSYISSTIIDGGSSGSVVTIGSGETNACVLNGFVIRNGLSFGGDGLNDGYGGGIFINNYSSPILDNLIVEDNESNHEGGGILVDLSNPVIRNSIIRRNSSGGIAIIAMSNPLIEGCIIKGNTAEVGAGIKIAGDAGSTEIRHTIISENIAEYDGGGLYASGTVASPCTVNLVNVTIVNNEALSLGGDGILGAMESEINIVNSIVWGNVGDQIFQNNASSIVNINFSDIQNGFEGDSNLNLAPQFDTELGHEFYLTGASPCIDTGDPDLDSDGTTWETDIDDQDPDGTRMDMGAYYFHQLGTNYPDSSGLFMLRQFAAIYNATVFDYNANQWLNDFTTPPMGLSADIISSVFDSRTNKILILTEYSDYVEFHSYSPDDNIWTILEPPPITGGITNLYMTYDDINNRTLVIRQYDDFTDLYIYNAADDSWDAGVEQPPDWGGIDNIAWVYHHFTNKSYLVREYGGSSWMYSYDLEINSWQNEDSGCPIGATLVNLSAASNIDDNLIYITGKDNGGVWLLTYNPTTFIWDVDIQSPPLSGGVSTFSLSYDYANHKTLLLREYNDFIDIYAYDSQASNWESNLIEPPTTGGVTNITSSFYSYGETILPSYNGSTLYVSTAGSDNTGNGSPEYPLSSIQHAVNRASLGDTILVGPGHYIENLSLLNQELTLCSWYINDLDTSFIGNTIIDGNDNDQVIRVYNSEITINGFTITNGYSTSGGGINSSSGEYLSIQNCVISNNIASSSGGAIYHNLGSLELVNTRVINNESYETGGALAIMGDLVDITDCQLMGNVSNNAGGAIYHQNSFLDIQGSVFSSNSVVGQGGGIYAQGGELSISSSLFELNSSSGAHAGAIYLGVSANFDSLIFRSNFAYDQGGALQVENGNTSITHSLFIDNTAGAEGQAISLGETAGLDLQFCTFGGNGLVPGSIMLYEDSDLQLSNSILWGNPGAQIIVQESLNPCTITVSYCDITNGENGIDDQSGELSLTWGEGNIELAPQFVSEENFSLLAISPCVDAGHPDLDNDGELWIVDPDDQDPDGTRMDMGAFYFHHEPQILGDSWVVSTDGSDVTGDGSFESPFETIQFGVDHLINGDTLLLLPGIYYQSFNSGEKSFTLKGEMGSDNTFIDFQNFNSPETNENIVFVALEEDMQVTIEGITFRNKWSEELNEAFFILRGEDIHPLHMRLEDVTFKDNLGQAIDIWHNVSLEIDTCTFENNGTQGNDGGAIKMGDANSSLPSTLSINRSRFINNFANTGGAIAAEDGVLTIEGCYFESNVSDAAGGGALFIDDSCTATIGSSMFYSNQTVSSGGALYIRNRATVSILNSVFSDNRASSSAATLFCRNAGTITIDGSIVYDNFLSSPQDTVSSIASFGNSIINIQNSVLWKNGDEQISLINNEFGPTEISIDYCDWEGGEESIFLNGFGELSWESNNFVLDPLFCDTSTYLFPVQSNSPLIGAGSEGANIGNVSIGCYPPHSGPIWHVSPDGSDESGEGSDESPFSTIQFAIDASMNSDTVLVQPGTYVENINFMGKNIVVGSLALTTGDTSYISQTVIDGNQSGSVVTFQSGEDSTAGLTGLTIQNGNATASTHGGGINITNSSPSLSYLKISNNFAEYKGGGLYCSSSHPIIHDVLISNNSTTGDGGGIYCLSSNPIIEDVWIISNSAHQGGGVFFNDSNPILVNFSILENTASMHGGGISCWYNHSSPIMSHGLIANNLSGGEGAGIYCYISNPELTNVTVTENTAGSSSGGGIDSYDSNYSLVNCIVWNNAPLEISDNPNNVSVTYSNIQDGWEDVGNIDTNPQFVDTLSGDYHLNSDSPCIDTGDPTSPLDADGTRADMGAYYFDQTFSFPQISISPDSLAFTVNTTEGFEHSQTLTISNTGMEILEVTFNTYSDTIVMDKDGNIYSTVQIGDQMWMAENLKVTHYHDGTAITNVTDATAWAGLTTEAYCIYNYNDLNEVDTYGALYNWYAATDNRIIAPAGWHVPTDAEWTMLEIYLSNNGHDGTEGDALKSTIGWDIGGNGTDDYGFSVLPGGYRTDGDGYYQSMGSYGYFWSATETSTFNAWPRYVRTNRSTVFRDARDKQYGASVRCLKDLTSWHTAIPTSLTIQSGMSADVTVTVTAEGLDLDEYSDLISISSNDPMSSTIEVPITMSVIFQDLTPPEVTLNIPEIVEPVHNRDTLNISWTASDNVGLDWAKLFFTSNEGASYSLYDSVDANLGEIDWIAPDVISNTCNFAIWVSDLSGNISADTLHGHFFIDDGTAPTISILNPNQSTALKEYDTLHVSWDARDNVGIEYFDFYYSDTPSEPLLHLTTISSGEDSSYAFILGEGVSDSVQVKLVVVDVAGNEAEDISEYFSITDNTPPFISQFSIPDTIEWGIGTRMHINVHASDNVEITGLDLNYSTDDGATWLPIIQGLYPVAGRPTYSWLIPDIPGECRVQAIVRDAVGLTDTRSSGPFTVVIEYPQLVGILPQLKPTMDMQLHFSQSMGSSDISTGTQLIGSVGGEYEIGVQIIGDDVTLSVVDGFISLDTLMLVLSASEWTNSFGYGLDGNGNGTYEGSPEDNDTSFTYVSAAGDFDQNGLLDFDDFDDFVLAWTNEVPEYELYPHQGSIPFINIQPDSIFNVYDLATFASMWNCLAGISLSAPLTETYPVEEFVSEQVGNMLTVDLNYDGLIATQTIVKYDPRLVSISIGNQSLNKVSASSLSMVNACPDSGFIMITSSHLDGEQQESLQLQLAPTTKHMYSVEVAVQGSNEQSEAIQKKSNIELLPIPTTFSLSQNYPNPFNASTTIEYGLPMNTEMNISIYDIRGRFVREIYAGNKVAGYHFTQWNGDTDHGHNVSSGLYFIVLNTPEYRVARKALILK